MASGVMTTVVNVVVLAIAYPVYLHFLGYEKYGVWLVLATVLSFAQLGNLGIGQAVMKLVAEEYGREDIKAVQRYITTALALLCVSGGFVLTLVLVFKSHILAAFKLSDENARMALWLLPYIGILSIYVFIVQALNAVLSGLGRMDMANYIQSAGRIVAVTIAGSLLYSGRGIESLLIGNVFSYILIHIASLIFIWRIARIHFLRIDNFNIQCCKKLLHFGGGVFAGSVVGMFLSPFNKLMLSRYAGVSSVPVYEIAYNGSMQVRGLFEVGLRALLPEISQISVNMTRSAKDRIAQINRRALKFIFLFGMPVYGILAIFSPLLLSLWLGNRYTEILPCVLRIMLVGTFLSLICVPAYYTLMGVGRVWHCLASQVIQAVLNAAIVGIIILFTGTVSVLTITPTVVISMGITSIYVLYQKHRAVKNIVC